MRIRAFATFLLLSSMAFTQVSPFSSSSVVKYMQHQQSPQRLPDRSYKNRCDFMETWASSKLSKMDEGVKLTSATEVRVASSRRREGKERRKERNLSQWEHDARSAINNDDFSRVKYLLCSLETTILPNGRNAVFVITETCRRSRNADAVVPLLQSIPDDILSFSEDDVMPFISECADAGNMKPVQLLITWMQSKGVQITAKVYSVMLKGYGRQLNTAMIDKIINTNKHIDVDIILINTCMDAYIRAGHPTSAIRLFGSLLRAHRRNRLTQSLQNVEDILYNHFEMPNKSDFKQVEHNFHNKMEPNTRSFNILLKALRSTHRAGYMATLDILDAMAQTNFTTVDSITLNTLVDICTQNGGIEEAEHLLGGEKEFMRGGIYPGVEAYTSLITAYADRAMLGNAFKVLDLMAKRDIKPNKYTLTSLMNACFRAEDFEAARSLLNKASRSSSPMKQEHLRSLHGAYLIGLSKIPNTASNVDKISKIRDAFLDILKMKVVPDTVTINAFIQSLCRNEPSRLREAMEIIKAMIHEGFCPDDFTYSILFTALGEAGEVTEVKELYQNAKVKFDEPTVNSLLKAYAISPDPLMAIEIFEDLTKRNYANGEIEYFIPTKITYTILFSALSQVVTPVRMRLIKESQGDDVILSEEISGELEKEGSEGMIEGVIGKSVNYDRIVRKLFKSMRFDYDIEVDDALINVINKLFCSKRSSIGVFRNTITTVLSKETAKLICDDLLLSGFHASTFEEILRACEYPSWKREKILALDTSRVIKKPSASYKIFNKYGWNKVDSGFNSIGF